MKPPPGVPWDAGGGAKAEALTPSHLETDFRDAQVIDFAGEIFRPVIAVGKVLSNLPPHRSVRAQFRHTALTSGRAGQAPDVEALAGPWMHDAWARQVAPDAGFHLLPRDAPSLAATSQTPEPETGDLVVKELQGPAVSGHREVSVVPSQHGPKPSTVLVDGLVHLRAEIVLDLPELG
jgi:hypothetical protein